VKTLERILKRANKALHATQPQEEAQTTPTRPRIGLALGGGFARGLAHIGVLKALEDAGIEINYLAGTSVGAVIAAAYSAGMSTQEMREIAALLKFSDFARYTISKLGFCSNDRMAVALSKLLKKKTFEELRIPLAVTATDFQTGEGVAFTSGSLVEPIRASCAYPGMFLPVEIDGRLLVDGLLAHVVPTEPLKTMGADRIIGVYLNTRWNSKGGPRHVFEVIGQCFSIAQDKMCPLWKADADLALDLDVSDYAYDRFDRCTDLICVGETAMKQQIDVVKSWFAATQKADKTSPAMAPKIVPA
jgi:NTE family protein